LAISQAKNTVDFYFIFELKTQSIFTIDFDWIFQ